MTDAPSPLIGGILQRLYDSEINVEIHWIWDGGVEWSLCDDGHSSGMGKTVAEAVEALANAAALAYPESDFGRWWTAR